jgi:hypothetical protein
MNRYDILLNKLPEGDLSVVKDYRTGKVLQVHTERILVLGNQNSGKTKVLIDDALKIAGEPNQYIRFISYKDTEIYWNLKDTSSFFMNSWEQFQCTGLKSSATALYLDDILFYKDMDGILLTPKEVLTWASNLDKIPRIVASCYLSEFSISFGYENKVIPNKIVIDQAPWIVKILG